MTLVFAASTTHYSISYDNSLSDADGKNRANSLAQVCEQDYSMMARWFPGLELPYSLPVAVNIIPGSYAGASWGPPISLRPGNGSSLDVVRYLLVAEVVEMFMLSQNKGWFASDGSNEGEAGEGLSRFLSAEFLHQSNLGWSMPRFDTAGLWLNSDRLDYINTNDDHDHAPDEKIGCATLFIYYLSYQLGYSVDRIVAAAAPTLRGVYRNLSGDTGDPFPQFKQMLDNAYPRKRPDGTPINIVLPGPNPDNPYPLNQYKPEVPVSARVFWQMNPGRNVVNLNWDAINADSVVMVSASEYNQFSQQLPDTTDQRFVGAADITVSNVTPHGPPFDPNHGVTFVVEVAWSAPLTVCTDIAVIANAPDAVVYVGPQTESGDSVPEPVVHRVLEARPEEPAVLSATIGTPRATGRGSRNGSRKREETRHELTI
ncbi:hypothetical protein A5784_01505 [Mycobacterium sp. 852013-50091_SCH5140682]|uniref:hypothetical protein n=1 Tax=Mycobacterium sp. 852013-50091_SCH5140682 TaxID=1834109 RepID=UPI0007EA0E8F|nr:hypothetical protein [Mycobacterium sp. 852013-50091_SCH5140682]OBC04216.1 hypothetical protein A5784_01505 [Mycobacterium sp. 852013-50091_SCH5140682]